PISRLARQAPHQDVRKKWIESSFGLPLCPFDPQEAWNGRNQAISQNNPVAAVVTPRLQHVDRLFVDVNHAGAGAGAVARLLSLLERLGELRELPARLCEQPGVRGKLGVAIVGVDQREMALKRINWR